MRNNINIDDNTVDCKTWGKTWGKTWAPLENEKEGMKKAKVGDGTDE